MALHELTLPKRIHIDDVVANSFKDFHIKGFDYICIKRTPTETLKLYFFDGDVSKMPEVVNPHDHRYDFETYVLAGASENVWFAEGRGQAFHRWDYFTPLNGGQGFREAGVTHLEEILRNRYTAGRAYHMRADEVHTIRIVENETVLMLRQFEDRVRPEVPTSTWTPSDKAPSLDGLYSRFTADEVIAKLTNFEDRTGIKLKVNRR